MARKLSVPDISGYLDYWKPGSMFRWDAAIVGQLNISNASKSFMIEIGLPVLDRPIGALGTAIWCASLPEHEADPSQRVIGDKGDIPILLRTGSTESLSRGSFRITGDGSNRFVEETALNSSILQHALLLPVLDQYQWKKGEFDGVDYPQRFDLLEARVQEIDPDIWLNEKSFWRTYIQGRRWAFEDGYD